MSNASINISLQNPQAASRPRGSLLLEQKDYAPLIGSVSKAAAVGFIGEMLYGEGTAAGWNASAECGLNDDGSLDTVVYAYPWPITLAYQIGCTHGELSAPVQTMSRQVEVLQFNLELAVSTRYPCASIVSAVPLGDLLDGNGAVVPLPGITTSGDTVTLSRRVFGSIKVVYESMRHAYALPVPRRDPAGTVENFYSSIVYAWYAGGGTWLDVQPPPGAEENAADGAPCGWSGSTSSGDDDDDDGLPKSAGADRHLEYDYCSGALLSDRTFPNTEY